MEKSQSLVLLIVGLVVGVSLGYGGAFSYLSPRWNSARSEAQSLKDQLSELKGVSKVSLHEGVVQLSPVVPMMGAQWVNPKDLPLGPIYLLTDDSRLIGIEYMYTMESLNEITVLGSEEPETFYELSGLPVTIPELGLERVVNHVDLAFHPQGHEGFEEDHWDIRIYFVSTEELEELTGARETPVQSQQEGNAPDFSLVDLDGNSFKLSDFRGKVVLLDFMATWCGPCKASMPGLVALHRELGEQVVMISIGVDPSYDSEETLREWMDQYGARWTHAKDLSVPPVSLLYMVRGIPTYVIIDKKGDVIFRHVGVTPEAKLKEELLSLLAE